MEVNKEVENLEHIIKYFKSYTEGFFLDCSRDIRSIFYQMVLTRDNFKIVSVLHMLVTNYFFTFHFRQAIYDAFERFLHKYAN